MRLLEILKDRFGALEAVANSSIKIARYAPEDEFAMDLLVAQSVLEFGSSLRQALDDADAWARERGGGACVRVHGSCGKVCGCRSVVQRPSALIFAREKAGPTSPAALSLRRPQAGQARTMPKRSIQARLFSQSLRIFSKPGTSGFGATMIEADMQVRRLMASTNPGGASIHREPVVCHPAKNARSRVRGRLTSISLSPSPPDTLGGSASGLIWRYGSSDDTKYSPRRA